MHSIVWGLLLAALPLSAAGQRPSPHRFRVLIHEIFADPSPSAGLPEFEFIELRNVSGVPINLKGWLLKDSSQTMKLPEYWLQADSLVVISARPVFSPGIAGSGFPSLGNDGETIALYDPGGALVHAVAYHKSWYGAALKSAGGWSLEMKDPRWPCTGAENWTASTAPAGGTPGTANSVAGNIEPPPLPDILRISVPDSAQVVLHFSAGTDSASAASPSAYSLPGIASVTVPPPLFNTTVLYLSQPLEKGRLYSLQATGLRDCAGRDAGPGLPVAFALPLRADSGDIVLNEVLFDPPPDTPDFLEIHNPGNTARELYPLHLATRGADGQLKQAVPLTAGPRMLLPGGYLAFTEDAAALCRAYACKGEVLQLPALPPMPDDEGRLVLLYPDGTVVDAFDYRRSFHLNTLSSARGVSLERLNPYGPSQHAQNWHSAAATAGYATPGYANSQLQDGGTAAGVFAVQPARFSPDNDGHEDVAAISWQLPGPGFTGSITVFDALGREVRLLAGNLLLGSSGKVFWDGLNALKMPAPAGIYIIFIRIFNGAGVVKTWKSALVLIRT
ncbi:hypothetical protein EGT74_07610 [Chitinophaga lutea]|uniref:LTD domain-containing protein n=1 Tax=Chitinophaga lutea TaxID=2488634 RepID=A0A3N4Q752_9BACT|nr:lamin tail domain-containing protein [Chitinophaga lutea]RPE13381.1 hypothetical protein EGT74_07610 [Chitinophaga lutea]